MLMNMEKKKKFVFMGIVLIVLIGTGIVASYFNNRVPSHAVSTDVQILEHEIVYDESGLMVKGVVLNNTPISITYVRMKVACGNGQNFSFTVGSRMEKRRAENRMTGQYEDREYSIPEGIRAGKQYQFEQKIDSGVVDVASCSLSVEGWTDYSTIFQ